MAVPRVADDEMLQRGVRPNAVDDEGYPNSQAFPVGDLKDPERRGISVHRKKFAWGKRDGDHPVNRWPRHVEAKAGDVRSIRSANGRQAFEVDADPTLEDRGHALVRFKDTTHPPASPRLERDKILEVFRDPDIAEQQTLRVDSSDPKTARNGDALPFETE